jgi:hypothetical protein
MRTPVKMRSAKESYVREPGALPLRRAGDCAGKAEDLGMGQRPHLALPKDNTSLVLTAVGTCQNLDSLTRQAQALSAVSKRCSKTGGDSHQWH